MKQTIPVTNRHSVCTDLRPIAELLPERHIPSQTSLLQFEDQTSEHYVTNPSAPRKFGNLMLIAARHEDKNDELSSEVHFYYYHGSSPMIRYDNFKRDGQDPFMSVGTFPSSDRRVRLMGYVRVTRDKKDPGIVNDYRTIIEENDSDAMPENFKLLFEGPQKTKGIRLANIRRADSDDPDNIVIYSRPHVNGGMGRVSCLLGVKNLKDVSVKDIENAPVIEGLCADNEWVGINDVHPLDNRYAILFFHLARYETDENGDPDIEQPKGYYSATALHDTFTGIIYNKQIIASHLDFQGVKPRRPSLRVTYPGGATESRIGSGIFKVFTGVGDTASASFVYASNRV